MMMSVGKTVAEMAV